MDYAKFSGKQVLNISMVNQNQLFLLIKNYFFADFIPDAKEETEAGIR